MSAPSGSGSLEVDELPYVAVWSEPTAYGAVVTVYRSTELDEDDPLFDPAEDVLQRKCTAKGLTEIVDDADMSGGQAEIASHISWNECPGSRIEHYCVEVFIPPCRSSTLDPCELQCGQVGHNA